MVVGDNHFDTDTHAPLDRLKPANRTDTAPAWHLHQMNGRHVLSLSGDWLAQSGRIPAFPPDGLGGPAKGRVMAFDITGVGQWDSGLVAFLWDAKQAAVAAGLMIDAETLPPSTRTLLGLLPGSLTVPPPTPRRRFHPLTWLGEATINLLTEIGTLSALLAGTGKGGFLALLGRARMRPVDLLDNIRDAGPSALLIISVVNFLLGAIFAFVGAVQLRRFAADIYVANLVGLALVREMAAVITAIVMAGRTGGAYAARIATMQGNEEIDALQVIGIPTEDYILLPSILALILTMPLLYLYGCLVGIFGGGVVAVSMLNVTVAGFVQQTLGAVPFSQFLFGFGKSIAFAILIGVTSCRIGLKAGRSAADVGTAATRAVVTGIVGVIALDSLFAVIATVFDF
jgi:phospholipid/cholesterol/gamma-HCH transport system permease protein